MAGVLIAGWQAAGEARAPNPADVGDGAGVGARGLSAARSRSPLALGSVPRARVQLAFFWAVGCPHCEDAKPFLEQLRQRRPELDVEAVEVRNDPEGRRRFVETMRRLGVARLGVPVFVVGERHVTGFVRGESEAEIEAMVDRALKDRAR